MSTATTGDKQQSPRTQLGQTVAQRVATIQGSLMADNSAARATLAQLRRAIGHSPGTVPEAWSETIELLPEGWEGRTDEPNANEYAVHHAMTLYALHQQGQTAPMHLTGIGVGRALRRLATLKAVGDEKEAASVRRRFDAVVTSQSPQEAAHHMRGLITLMRGDQIGLDYGLLAEDLHDLWTSARVSAVRLRWARDYYRRDKATTDQSAKADETEE